MFVVGALAPKFIKRVLTPKSLKTTTINVKINARRLHVYDFLGAKAPTTNEDKKSTTDDGDKRIGTLSA
jgi:hypothetical protein